MPDLSGKTAIVTGANSGIGLEAARELARHGAQVVLAVRNLAKGEAALADIRGDMPGAAVEVRQLDLASLASVRTFAAAAGAAYPTLDLLVNNAGVMALPYHQTVDGFEMQFGTNHLGHFALTGLLLGPLLAAPAARVVTVASLMHRYGSMDFDNLQWEQGYDKWRAYSRSKLANMLFAFELQRKFAAAGVRAISVAAHPGYAATNLQLAGPQMENSGIALAASKLLNKVLAQSAEMGALPTLYAGVADDVQGGDFIGPGGLGGARGYPTTAKASDAAYDATDAARLWTISEELTGVRYAALGADVAPAQGSEALVLT
jgi:NAD(P)-dependent dehydrogenase (short-subunit alcohol dehydrogenase family)